MHALKFKRKSKGQKNNLAPREEEQSERFFEDNSRRHRFQRPTEILKSLNISLTGKMEEMRLLPLKHDDEEIGSFFFDELEALHMSETSQKFYIVYLELVDLCQTLPLVLLNKKRICEILLEKVDDIYYQPIIGKLLVELFRDCQGELYDEALQLVIPILADKLDVVQITMIQTVFSVFAAALKYMLKICLKKFDEFTICFVKHTILKTNPYLRRFSTECLTYLIKKIRNEESLKKRVNYLFSIKIDQLDLYKNTIISTNTEYYTEELLNDMKDDYLASLLYEILKGNNGYLNEQTKDFLPVLSKYMEKPEHNFIIKGLNLLLDSEFKFYLQRKKIEQESSRIIGNTYEMADLLVDIFERAPEGAFNTQKRLIRILTDILMFKEGDRFNQKLVNLAQNCVKGQENDLENLRFLGTYMLLKKTAPKQLEVLAAQTSLTKTQISCLLDNLVNQELDERTEVKKLYREVNKKIIVVKIEVKLEPKCFQFLVILVMKYLEENLESIQSDAQNQNILAIFLHLCDKNKASFNGELKLKQGNFEKIISMIEDQVNKKNCSFFENHDFFLMLTLLDLLSKSQFESNNQNIKNLVQRVVQKMSTLTKNLKKDTDNLFDSNGQIANKNFYDKSLMSSLLLESKNGSLKSTQDLITYISQPLTKLILKKVNFTVSEKNELVCQILESTLFLDNLNWIVTKNLVLYKNWLRTAGGKYSHTKILQHIQENTSYKTQKQILDILLRALQSQFFNVRNDLIEVLWDSVIILENGQEIIFHVPMLNMLQVLNLKKVSFYTERDIVVSTLDVENFLVRHCAANEISKMDIELLVNFLIGFTSVRLGTLTSSLQTVFFKIQQMFGVQVSTILINCICVRNLFHQIATPIEIGQQITEFGLSILQVEEFAVKDQYIIEEDKTDYLLIKKNRTNITVDRLEIFKSMFKKEIDFIDTNTHLNKLFELLPAMLGLPSKKNSGYNKSQSSKQHDDDLQEAQETRQAMNLKFDNEELIEEEEEEENEEIDKLIGQNNNSIQANSKRQDTEEMRNVQDYVFEFFVQFLHNEVSSYILPTLKKHINRPDVEAQNEMKDMDQEEVHFFEHILKNYDKSEGKSNMYMLQKMSTVNRMNLFLNVFKAMKKLPTTNFNSQLNSILLEILKYPDTQMQQSTLDVIKKAKKTSDMFNDYFQLFKDLTEKNNFKGNLLTFKNKFKDLESLEKKEMMPIANALLYRKLVDKRGTGTYKNLSSTRDFVLDTISAFSKEELDRLIETMFMTYGLDIYDLESDIDMHKILRINEVTKVVGLVETLKNLIKKLGLLIMDHLPYMQKFILKGLKVQSEFQAYFKDEKVKTPKGTKSESQISIRQLQIVSAEADFKSLKQACLSKVKDIYANYIELELTQFTNTFCIIQAPIISTMHEGSYQKLPKLFQVFGCWSECEMYKTHFLQQPQVLTNLIKLVETPKITIQMFEYITDLLRSLSNFKITDEECKLFNLKTRVLPYINKNTKYDSSSITDQTDYCFKLVNEQDDRKFNLMSKLGCGLIKKNLNQLLTSMSIFSNNVFGVKKLQNISRSQMKKVNILMSEFCMFMAYFCESDNAETQVFISIMNKFWDVDRFNKTTDLPQRRIRTAEELVNFEKEIEFQSNLLGLMANLACKVDNIQEFYKDVVLKFVAKLGNNSLRKILGQVCLSLTNNPNFSQLGLDLEVTIELSNLYGSRRKLNQEDYDFNSITEILLTACKDFDQLSPATRELYACNCIYWVKLDELSVREKGLEYLELWINSLDCEDKNSIQKYKHNILDTAVYYINVHYGNEAQIKSAFRILDFNLKFGKKVDPALYDIPYLDLEGLESVDKKNKKLINRFIDQVLDLKINSRQRAFMIVREKIDKGKIFHSRTIKNILTPLVEYFVFEFWSETTSEYNSYSSARVDRVKSVILESIKVYGKTVGMLTFPQYIKFVKELIFQIGKPFKNQDIVLKLVCSCLDNVSSSVTDVLKVINQDYKSKNTQSLKNSFISTVLKTYHDSKLINQGRLTAVYEDYDYNQEKLQLQAQEKLKTSEKAIYGVESDKMDIEDQNENLEIIKDNEELVEELEEDKDEVIEGEDTIESSLTPTQLATLKSKILLPLKKHLMTVENDEKKNQKTFSIRSDVAIAVVKLIRIFPINVFNQELIGTLHKIGKCLKSKDEPSRNEARKTLCKILRELGPFFLGFIVKELKFYLTHGFEVHTRNFTIFQLLETLMDMRGQGDELNAMDEEKENDSDDEETTKKSSKILTESNANNQTKEQLVVNYGEIDYCVGDIAEMILDEVAGSLAQEKETTEIRGRTKEFRGNKGLECFRMLAMLIDFKSDAVNNVVIKIEDLFKKNENLAKSIKKFDELLNYMILGFSKNTTITKDALFLWTLSTNRKAIEALVPQTLEADQDMVPEKEMNPIELKRFNMDKTYKIQQGAAEGHSIFAITAKSRDVKTKPFGRLISNFALNLLYKKLRSPLFQVDFSDEAQKQQMSEYMNPMIDQLVLLMNSEISKLVQISLQIVSHVVNWPVWNIENKGRKMLRIIIKIFDKIGSNDLEIVQSCFKMMKKIVLTNNEFLANSQISSMYEMIQDNLYRGDQITEPLQCLNALISQKLFKDKLYDLLDDVFSGMVKTIAPKMRLLSKSVLENFIENAPMSENLLEKFLLKLINNLNYEAAEGRFEVVDLLLKFVLKFPAALFTQHVDVMLLGVVTAIVNEQNFSIKQKMKLLASQLILNMDSEDLTQKIDSYIKYSEQFLESEKVDTQRAGIVLIDSMFSAGLRDSRVKSKLKVVGQILEKVSEQIGEFYINVKEEKDLSEQMKTSAWRNIMVTDGASGYLIAMKNSKDLIVDCLFLASTFINSEELELDEVGSLVRSILEIKNHPDEDIRLLVTDMMCHLFSIQDFKDLLKENLKSLLMLIFSNLKAEEMKEEVFMNKSQLMVLVIFFEFGQQVGSLRVSFLAALDSVVIRALKYYKKKLIVYSKVVGLIELLLANCNGDVDQQVLESVLGVLLKFQLNGNVSQDKDLMARVEVVSLCFYYFYGFILAKV